MNKLLANISDFKRLEKGNNLSRNLKSHIFAFYESQKEAYAKAEHQWRLSKPNQPNPFKPMSKGEAQFIEFNDVVDLVENDEGYRCIYDLFKKIGEDHRDMVSWLMFVRLIASQLMDADQGGRPPKWKPPSKAVLKQDLRSSLTAHPRMKGINLAEEMKRRFPKKYDQVEPTTILRLLGTAKISLVDERRKVKAKLAKRTGQN